MHRMTRRAAITALAFTSASLALPSSAQLPDLSGKAGGLLGGMLPNLATTGAGNAAGMLSYCVKNKLVNAASATSVLGKLTGKQGVKESSGYSLGQKGVLQTQDNRLSVANLKGKVKSKLCGMVLSHAASLL
ncbi:DUF2501 domain-containing protein [Sphingobium estronivorans]|uniref:DUF2501 domain-containing protein n=1 Tax=Sphingobium estronivorans TaxID=1577690 RepID=UPI00123AD009|nr:DUF2501 domain-containing protein [Sphingobium estronivorans]